MNNEQQERQQERQRERQKQDQQQQQQDQRQQTRQAPSGNFEFRKKEVTGTQKQKPKLESVKVVAEKAGNNGEKNLQVQWLPMPLPEQNAISVYFDIKTVEGNSLNVEFEQAQMKRTYKQQTHVETCYAPVAPHGTKGKIKITDVDTGEYQEVDWEWEWHTGWSFWDLVKKVFSFFFKR